VAKKKPLLKVAPKKAAVKKPRVKKVSKATDPRMVKLQNQQKKLAVEEAKVKAEIKKEQQAIKSADAKCMSNAKNLHKHVMHIKAGMSEYQRALKAANNSNAVEAAMDKLISKIQTSIDAVRVVRDLKFNVLKLIDGGGGEPEDDDDEFGDL